VADPLFAFFFLISSQELLLHGTPGLLLLEELEDERQPTQEVERQLGRTVELPLELEDRVERLQELEDRLGELLPLELDRRRTALLLLRAATLEEVGLRARKHQPT